MADFKVAKDITQWNLLLNYMFCSTLAYKCTVISGSQNNQRVKRPKLYV